MAKERDLPPTKDWRLWHFAQLEAALKAGNLAKARKAMRELERLGIEIRFTLPPVPCQPEPEPITAARIERIDTRRDLEELMSWCREHRTEVLAFLEQHQIAAPAFLRPDDTPAAPPEQP